MLPFGAPQGKVITVTPRGTVQHIPAHPRTTQTTTDNKCGVGLVMPILYARISALSLSPRSLCCPW